MRLSCGLFVLAFGLAVPTSVVADEVYKSTMPDGSVAYGETPHPNARKWERIEARSATTGTVVVTDKDKTRADRIKTPSGPAVGVVPQEKREPEPRREPGTLMNPAGVMPKRSY